MTQAELQQRLKEISAEKIDDEAIRLRSRMEVYHIAERHAIRLKMPETATAFHEEWERLNALWIETTNLNRALLAELRKEIFK